MGRTPEAGKGNASAMSGCGCSENTRFDGLSTAYKRVLIIIIALNATMFAVEMVAGMAAGSMALKADALDFLGDSLTYGLSLWVIGRTLRVRASAALVKGVSLALMGAGVLGATLWNVFVLGVPNEMMMGTVGVLALMVNIASVLLLLRFRDGDANVRSVWLCSRNDAIGNLAVIVAALAVGVTATAWPDLIVAALMSALFLQSSIKIIRQALAELRSTGRPEAVEPA